MIDLEKHLDFFNPEDIGEEIHVIGCGAVGSTLIEMLTRTGCQKINIYDFDIVEPHNITNQMFLAKHINLPKALAIAEICKSINPSIDIIAHTKGYIDQPLSGYVFLCADSMDVRRTVAENNEFNMKIKAMMDFRMGLADGQHFFVNWKNSNEITAYIDGAQFKSEEADANAPRNACGTFLNIIPTVRTIVSCGIVNFMKFVKGESNHKIILINVLSNQITCI